MTRLPFLLLLLASQASAAAVNPVQRVVALLTDLKAKITKEGETELKAFKEYTKWCDDTTQQLGFDIKTATAAKAEAEAALAKCTSEEDQAKVKIGELAADIAAAERNLGNATGVRKAERGTFTSCEAELMDAIDTLSRAISVLSKEMAKNPALLQSAAGSNINSLVGTLSAVIDAASFSGTDRQKLMALVQSKQAAEDDEDELGAPAAAAYKTHSGSILDILEDMKDKAEEELTSVRKSEMEAVHQYDLLKQALTDESTALTKELGETKAAKAEAAACMAQQTSDLDVATGDLKKSTETKASVEQTCATTAEDHKASMAGRAEELSAIEKAIAVLTSKTVAAQAKVYSLVQEATSRRASQGVAQSVGQGNEVIEMVSRLAKRQHSTALTQLANRIGAVLKYASTIGEDPFAKVKGLIEEMIARLEKEASAEASHKAYCDDETAKTKAKKEELTSDIDSLSAKIDKATATSAKLKTEVAELQKELGDLLKLQGEMDTARADEKAAFAECKVDLETGIAGVQEAIRILREYYGSTEETALVQQPEMPDYFKKAAGSGSSIIEILEVVESDFTKSLAQETLAEESAQAEYDKMTQENKITKASKEQDVKYKSQEAAGLDKAVAENSSDREGLQTQLSAVLEYSEKLVEECVAKPETYEDCQARRAAEIAGLKEALTYLEAPAALIEQSRSSSGARRFRAARA